MSRIYLDLESYSAAPIAKIGAERYALDPSTRILMVGYAFDDAPVGLVEIGQGQALPAPLLEALADPAVEKWAHNAAFERAVLRAVLGLPCPPEQWRCTAVWARTLGLPAGLAALARELRLPEQKLDPDKRLVTLFCTPQGAQGQQRLDRAQDWASFRDYCKRDVGVCRAICARLADYPVPEDEWALWALDQHVNDRGLPVDRAFVRHAINLRQRHTEAVLADAQTHTGLPNPRSRTQMLGWLKQTGAVLPDLRQETVAARLADPDTSDTVRQALQYRQQLASTSVAKYDTIETMQHEGRIRGAFQFYGAGRTGRWAGRGFQPHNLPCGSAVSSEVDLTTARAAVVTEDPDWVATLFGEDVIGLLSTLVRTAIAAPGGKQLVVADYASIEAVMLAWAAGSDYLLNLFRTGRDPYKDFATHLFSVPYAEVTKSQRTQVKPVLLGCGYGLGTLGLQRYAATFGRVLGDTEAATQVAAYREVYPDIPQFWEALRKAAFGALRTDDPHPVGAFTFIPDLPRYLLVALPSGRFLAYYRPQLEPGKFGEQLTYVGREMGVRVGTHPGKLAENLIQAISRDVLAYGLLRAAEDPGMEIVGHVHDEIICLADAADQDALGRLTEAMTAPPWCPDAPIRAIGWTGPWYRKD